MKYFLLLTIIFLFSCKAELIKDLEETQAIKIIAHLQTAGIKGQKTETPDGAWSILVDESEFAKAYSEISKARLTKKSPNLKQLKTSLTTSETEQKFILEQALASNLEATLSSLDGVLEARVHLNLPKSEKFKLLLDDGAKADLVQGSASVLLFVSEKIALNSEEIKGLISGACGLNPAAVNVLINQKPDSTSAKKSFSSAASTQESIEETTEEKPALATSPIQHKKSDFTQKLKTSFASPWIWGAAFSLICILALFFVQARKKKLLRELNS